jgi:hypothetical protein
MIQRSHYSSTIGSHPASEGPDTTSFPVGETMPDGLIGHDFSIKAVHHTTNLKIVMSPDSDSAKSGWSLVYNKDK